MLLLCLWGGALALAAEDLERTADDLDINTWDGKVTEDMLIPKLGYTTKFGEGYVNFRIWDNRMRVYFLDENEKVIEPPVGVITVQADITNRDNEFDRLVSKGDHLEGRVFYRPAYIMRIIARIKGPEGGDDIVKTFMFRQDYIDPE